MQKIKNIVELRNYEQIERIINEKNRNYAEYGMVETLSYPFVGDEDYKNFALDADATKKVSVEIANPATSPGICPNR